MLKKHEKVLARHPSVCPKFFRDHCDGNAKARNSFQYTTLPGAQGLPFCLVRKFEREQWTMPGSSWSATSVSDAIASVNGTLFLVLLVGDTYLLIQGKFSLVYVKFLPTNKTGIMGRATKRIIGS